MAEIRTKREFFELWEGGFLGNRLQTWRDPEAALASGCSPVGFREIGKAGGGKLEIVERSAILATAAAWKAAGRAYMICEAAPDQHATIQGEVCRTAGPWGAGYAGLLGRVVNGRRMRDSIAAGDLKPVTGLRAKVMIDTFMDPASRDDLEALLEIYPDASVEFTCYTKRVGFLNRNTIFWEVRNY